MGRPPKVSREEILDAAARADPLELQLTRLAQDLGISVKTVYYYFPTRRALLDALTERAVAGMGLPAVGEAQGWREALTRLAHWCYRLGADQPGWFNDPVTPRGVGLRVILEIQGRLAELGWSEQDALRAYAAVSNWAVSAGEAASRTRELGGLSVDNIRRHLDDYADPEAVERLSRLMASMSVDQLFEDGLEIVLAGVEARLLARARPAG
jgi:AcrR family transcriptional regulator